ncbi:MAG: carbonic anhydrase [Pseudohongiellaceae bacterium]
MNRKLKAGYERFRQGYLKENREQLQAMAEVQQPSCIMITCCDARLDPGLIFDTEPGELFVIRNVANLVPPCEDQGTYHGTSAALEFAVTVLEVPNIVVLGHSRCGGIRALVAGQDRMQPASFIDRWMSIAAPVRELARPEEVDDEAVMHRCEKAAVGHSLGNLMTYSWIAERVEAGSLVLHGMHYDIYSGSLEEVSQ